MTRINCIDAQVKLGIPQENRTPNPTGSLAFRWKLKEAKKHAHEVRGLFSDTVEDMREVSSASQMTRKLALASTGGVINFLISTGRLTGSLAQAATGSVFPSLFLKKADMVDEAIFLEESETDEVSEADASDSEEASLDPKQDADKSVTFDRKEISIGGDSDDEPEPIEQKMEVSEERSDMESGQSSPEALVKKKRKEENSDGSEDDGEEFEKTEQYISDYCSKLSEKFSFKPHKSKGIIVPKGFEDEREDCSYGEYSEDECEFSESEQFFDKDDEMEKFNSFWKKV